MADQGRGKLYHGTLFFVQGIIKKVVEHSQVKGGRSNVGRGLDSIKITNFIDIRNNRTNHNIIFQHNVKEEASSSA